MSDAQVIQCPVCAAVNDNRQVRCSTCKAYIQARVDVLHLFDTIWGLIERPSRTFQRIIISAHKNYVVLLGSLVGIRCMFLAFSLFGYRSTFDHLPAGLGAGIVAGIPAGLLGIAFLSGCALVVARSMGGSGTWKNMNAVIAYACIPLALNLVLVFPVHIAVFGFDHFGTNPHPFRIQPAAYALLAGMDVTAVLWTLALLTIGISRAAGLGIARGLVPSGTTVIVSGGLISLAGLFNR